MYTARIEDAEGKMPPNHFDMRTFPLIKKTPGNNLALSVSHYLPGGGVGLIAQPVEAIYYVLSGTLTVETEDGEIVLEPATAFHMSPGDKKALKNKTNMPATMLVIANVPEGFE